MINTFSTKEDIKYKIFRTISNLYSLKESVITIIEKIEKIKIDDSENWAKEYEVVIKSDPIIAPKILAYANSTKPITEIKYLTPAMRHIGSNHTKAIIYASLPKDDVIEEKIKPLWRHAEIVASLSYWFAKVLLKYEKKGMSENERDDINAIAYIAGLLHDIGKIILIEAFEDELNVTIPQNLIDILIKEKKIKIDNNSKEKLESFLTNQQPQPKKVLNEQLLKMGLSQIIPAIMRAVESEYKNILDDTDSILKREQNIFNFNINGENLTLDHAKVIDYWIQMPKKDESFIVPNEYLKIMQEHHNGSLPLISSKPIDDIESFLDIAVKNANYCAPFLDYMLPYSNTNMLPGIEREWGNLLHNKFVKNI